LKLRPRQLNCGPPGRGGGRTLPGGRGGGRTLPGGRGDGGRVALPGPPGLFGRFCPGLPDGGGLLGRFCPELPDGGGLFGRFCPGFPPGPPPPGPPPPGGCARDKEGNRSAMLEAMIKRRFMPSANLPGPAWRLKRPASEAVPPNGSGARASHQPRRRPGPRDLRRSRQCNCLSSFASSRNCNVRSAPCANVIGMKIE
jgi:hypothetical protein